MSLTKPTNAPELGVAVIGCGAWGRNHVRAWRKLGALRMVVDASPAAVAAAAELAPGVEAARSAREALGSSAVQAVVVAAPAAQHAALALEAIAAGKHVLVEKPLALSLGEARAVVEAARRRGVALQVGHLLEYHPAFLELRRRAAAGELGQLRWMESRRLNFGRVRLEEDALWSLAPHDLSLMARLAGRAPARCACAAGFCLGQPRADVVSASLDFGDGLRAALQVGWLHPSKEQRLVIIGAEAMAVFDDVAPQKLAISRRKVEWDDAAPRLSDLGSLLPSVEPAEPLLESARAFLRAAAGLEPVLADGLSALRVMAALEACARSLREGGAPQAVEPIC